MRTSFYPAALLAALLLTALTACQKESPDSPNANNPPEVSLPGAGFSITVLDFERGRHPDSAYVFEGVWRDGHFRFGRERLDTMQLNITETNGITLKISSEDLDFRGVNARSSTRSIDIVPDGTARTQYHLERVCEGASAITLWNGEGTSRQEIRFTVTSREDIPAEAIRIRIDGREYLMSHGFNSAGSLSGYRVGKSPSAWEPYLQELVKVFPGRREDDRADHVELEIAGCVPLERHQSHLYDRLRPGRDHRPAGASEQPAHHEPGNGRTRVSMDAHQQPVPGKPCLQPGFPLVQPDAADPGTLPGIPE